MQAKGPTLDITVLRDRKGPNNQLMPIDNSCFEKIIVFQYVMRVCSTFGGSSLVTYFGGVHNPWELGHIAGGSSGGSAAAVAGGLCFGALGSDTAGSIRQPAGYCGIVGLKPTYGRVSTSGVIPLAWSLDHLGPITRTAMDAALMLQVIAGYDTEDTASVDVPVPNYVATIAAAT